MSHAIAATVPSEVAARKLAEWLGKIIHRVNVASTGATWSIFVPEAALSRARRALREVIVAANPPPRPGGACCKALGKGATCAKCRKHAHFTVDWIIPSRIPDNRAACSSACAVALKKTPGTNAGRLPRRRTFTADHRIMSQVGNLIEHGRLEEAADLVEEHSGRRPTAGTLRAKYSGMTLGGEPAAITYRNNRTRAKTNPANKRARRELRRREQRVKESLGLSGRPLAKRTQWTGRTDAFGHGQRAGSGYVRFWLWNDREWKLNLRSSYDGVGGEPTLRESAKTYADEQASKTNIVAKFPGQLGKWKAGFILAFEQAIAAAFGPKREFSEDRGEYKDERDIEKRLWRRLAEKRKKLAARQNPSAEQAWAAMKDRPRAHALEFAGIDWDTATRLCDRPWGQLPPNVRDMLKNSWESSTTRRTHGTTKRMVRVNSGRYLIQGLRPKHRNWVTISVVDDEERALINALRRARLGDVMYRVWDTGTVKEVWRGQGKDAKVERWHASRPAGLVGANRRKVMHRNPRLSKRMQPLRENTMRLGDAMKWGRRLLDAGIGVHLWDGSGWEIGFKPDDSYSTPSGRAARGGRRYLSQGAGLIKTWPITLTSPTLKAGVWLTPATISHFLSHRQAGVARNPGVCKNPICNRTVRRNNGDTLADLDRQFSVLQRELEVMKKSGADKGPDYLVKLQALAALSKRRLAASGIVIRRAGENPRRGIYCTMCGADRKKDGPFRRPKVGPQRGKIICDQCYRGWRSGRRSGEKWAQNRGSRRNSDTVAENVRIAHEQIVEAFLAGRSKKVGPRYWTDGNLLRVWGNLVAQKVPGGVQISDAGYRTLLTKNVLNTVLRHLGQGTIWQQARQWYISTPQGKAAWPGSWTISRGAGANRGRRVRRNGRGENLTVSDIEQWIDNDEGLYNWWRGSRQSKRAFISANRAQLEASIKGVLNRPPAQKTWRDYAGTNPRVRAWNIVAITPGRGRETMQSGHKDKKKAEDIAKLYRTIAKKEGRRTRYVVEPFRYSDTASRRNPAHVAYNVYLKGRLIDTVFWVPNSTVDEVYRSLVNHDGYDHGIKVVKSRAKRHTMKNPLNAKESARLIRAARGFMAQGRSADTTRKERHYRFGQASGMAAAVQVSGPRRAEVPAAMVRGRAMKAHRVMANPHAGLKGLMSNGAAKKAMRFA